MDKTDYEMTVMVLEQYYPEIMKRIREGAFTRLETGFIIYGIAMTYTDKEEFSINYNYKGFIKRLSNVDELVDYIMEVEDKS